jgi:2-(1,2-epoxy-1,2-dihydrophenyl)acetyl-CoA isomerase
LIFSAREVDPAEAKSLGLVYAIRPAASLREDALALASQFHSASTEALGMAKATLNQAFHLDQQALTDMEAADQAIAFSSDYHAAAVVRFKNKQVPGFTWKELFLEK